MIFNIGGIQIRTLQASDSLELFEMFAECDGQGPGLHIHQKMEESFYILSGSIQFTIGKEKQILREGESLCVRRNTALGWQTASKNTKMLIFFTPAQNQLHYYAQLEKLQSVGNSWADAILHLSQTTDNTPVFVKETLY